VISIGRGIRWYNRYQDEVDFCIKNQFDFMQLWFRDGSILVNDLPEPKEEHIRRAGFPVLLHAVFDPVDFGQYGGALLDKVAYLGGRDVIVHPVCKKSPIDQHTEYKLAEQAKRFSAIARARGIVWYLENNSVIDGFHYQAKDLEIVFRADPYVEQVLDVAHIDNYRHLEEIAAVKFPKCLHAAGKHFQVPHEHLPLDQGDIDYRLVFREYLHGYDGKIVLEVTGTDEELIRSKQIIDEAAAYA